MDGTKLNDSISYWNQNEPSNDFGGEDCVELYSWYNTGKWNDNKCTAKRHYVCEKISGKPLDVTTPLHATYVQKYGNVISGGGLYSSSVEDDQ